MPLSDTLRSLLTAAGPSGREFEAAAVWQSAAKAFTDDVASDVMGNSVARIPSRPPTASGPLMAVVGHVDQIGMIVTHIDDDGFLWFSGVGGWDPVNLVGQRVELLSRGEVVSGVVGKKPIHLLESEEREKAPKLKSLHIDIGAKDGDEARSRVRVGDMALVAGEPLELLGDRVASRAMDNRLGAYVALEVARLVSEDGGAPGPVAAVASAQEEIGGHGAMTATFGLEPDLAIVVDVCHATDAPGVDKRQEGDHGLGSGPVIGHSAVLHPVITELLRDTAEAEGIDVGHESSGRGTFTDADSMHLVRTGVPCGLVSIPLRYMHSPVEVVELADVEATARLIAAFARRLSDETTFVR